MHRAEELPAADRHGARHGRGCDRRAHQTVQLEDRTRPAVGRVCGVLDPGGRGIEDLE